MTALDKLLNEMEEICDYYKTHEMHGDYLDMRQALDRYYNGVKEENKTKN